MTKTSSTVPSQLAVAQMLGPAATEVDNLTPTSPTAIS